MTLRNAVTSEPPFSADQAKRKGKFNLNRAQVIDQNFVEFVRQWSGGMPARPPDAIGTSPARRTPGTRRGNDEPIVPGTSLTVGDAVELFESQIISRHQDIVSREMRARGEGFYTIGSCGHEGNAVVGRLTRHTDIAFVHYRSGAFMAERARKVPGVDFVRDTMLSFAASSQDPIAGGRHKVLGSVELWVPPQTSTIASHLSKAVGTAVALNRVKRLRLESPIPEDSIVVCSFGDATCNHSVAQTAFNSAGLAAYQRFPTPILLVCEDNGIGISVETPPGWIEAQFRNRAGLTYFQADGLDLVNAYAVSQEAIELCRSRRCPVFLHLKVVRLLGHAGSDAETEYHSWEEIEAAEAKDPLPASADLILRAGVMTPEEVLALYERSQKRVRDAAAEAAKKPKLLSAEEIIAPLAPYSPEKVAKEAARTSSPDGRIAGFDGEDNLPERGQPKHMAALLNAGLYDILLKYPEAILFGEDVAKKGGVYHVTTGLHAKFGGGRVFNTLLDETTILGLGIGAAHLGLLPIPEIQYLAYYHNAEDQIRGEAGSLQFFSQGQYRNPMVIRIAGWGYQKGFGGHFHNDNSIAALRDVPGLIVCTPSRGDDAVKMLRTCMALAQVDGRVIAFIEPIALYMTRDLYEPKDGLWSFAYPPPDEFLPLGEGRVYRDGVVSDSAAPATGGVVAKMGTKGRRDEERKVQKSKKPRVQTGGDRQPTIDSQKSSLNAPADDLTILTFANGVPMSLRAAKALREKHKVHVRVVDLRWLNPLNETLIIEQSQATGRVLVVDEGRRTGGVSEAILALIQEQGGSRVKSARLTARDTYIPLGPAADYVLPQDREVVDQALACLR